MSSPIFIPTTVIAQVRDLAVDDLAVTSVSCTNLTVGGQTLAPLLQNISTSSAGNTVFTGTITADGFSTTGTFNAGTLSGTTGNITGNLFAGSITSTGSVSGSSLAGTISTAAQPNITSVGPLTSLSVSGSSTLTGGATVGSTITQSSGSATLKSTTVDSLSTTGNISQTSTGNFSTNGNITQSNAAATATLKATSVTTLSTTGAVTASGNITTPQLLQTLPSFNLYTASNQGVGNGTEEIFVFLNTATVNQGTATFSYSNGAFNNNSGVSRAYLCSYSMTWAGVTGGRRQAYIRTSNLAGNYPRGAGTGGPTDTGNTAVQYQVGVDASPIYMSGSQIIVVAPGGTWALYAYQNGGGTSLACTATMSVTSI